LKRVAIEAEKRGESHSCSLELSVISYKNQEDSKTIFKEVSKDGRDFLILQHNGIKVEREISHTNSLLIRISVLIFLFTIGLLLLTFFYSKILSHDVQEPINLLNNYLDNINEKSLNEIPKEKLPEEFHLLADTLNNLLKRIEIFISTQKELFIGASHELKTPLAVIKLKNQVTLLKKREPEDYIEVLRLINEKIDEMNKVVSDVLNIGRQESAQFEPPVEKDVISILKKKSNDFSLLSQSQGKFLFSSLQPNEYIASIQETLLNHIIQNFLQNALKFTPKGKKIELRSFINEKGYLTIEVVDEGIGVDEKQDMFAPFNRKGDKSGVGLGLFLAKSAADSMGAKISVKNRIDGIDGAVASLELKNRLICTI
jgi:two-component system OmpR family sensor kinase